MPRKTKENNELKDELNKGKKVTKKSSTKKATTAKSATKKASTKKASTAKSATKKASTKEATTAKSASKKASTKEASTAKSASKKASTKEASTAESATKKTSTKKATSKKKSSIKGTENEKVEIVEYYDLPYRYNQTIIKTLAQTPTTLFIYWDISDKDRKDFENQYGENFFQITKPILIVYNDTLGYKFEIEINDFANSWYLHVADSKCNYRIELGRRPIQKNENINVDYIYITSSNKIESPNDKILFDPNQKMVYFRNVKTNVETSKSINTLSFIRNMGKIYDIYDLYKEIYQNENIEEIYDNSNPSSSPSSRFF